MASLFRRYSSILCESTTQAQRDGASVPPNGCEIKGCNSGLSTLIVLQSSLCFGRGCHFHHVWHETSKACADIFTTTAADKEENTPLSFKIALPGRRGGGQGDIVDANICARTSANVPASSLSTVGRRPLRSSHFGRLSRHRCCILKSGAFSAGETPRRRPAPLRASPVPSSEKPVQERPLSTQAKQSHIQVKSASRLDGPGRLFFFQTTIFSRNAWMMNAN